MSEFVDKLQSMKDGMNSIVSQDDNPALISSDLVDDDGELLSSNESHEVQEAPVSRPDKSIRKQRIRNNLKNRLDQLIADNRLKDLQQQQLIARLQEQERLLTEERARAEQNAHYGNVYYEQSLENDEQRVVTELEIAKENSDIKKEIEMQKRLAEIAAKKQTQLLHKTLQQQQPRAQPQPMDYAQPPYYPEPQYASPPQEPVNDHFEDWLDDNPWADRSSPSYDSALNAEVNAVAAQFNEYLKDSNATNMIGTREYFDTIDNIMRDKMNTQAPQEPKGYVDYSDNPAIINNNYITPPSSYQPSAYSSVAPVTKKGSSMADRYMSNTPNSSYKGVSLTKDQIEFAKKLAPTLTATSIDGKQYTEQEAIAEYVRQLQDINRQQGSSKNQMFY